MTVHPRRFAGGVQIENVGQILLGGDDAAGTADHRALGRIPCREQRGRSVAPVVVRNALYIASPIGSIGCVRSSA